MNDTKNLKLIDLEKEIWQEYFEPTQVSLTAKKRLTDEVVEFAFLILLRNFEVVKWQMGDLVVLAEGSYEKLAAKYEVNQKTLEDWAYVARNVPRRNRFQDLSFNHHRAVAKLELKNQVDFLKLAKDNGWSVRRLREEIAGDDEELPIFSDRLFELEEENAELHRRIDSLMNVHGQVRSIFNQIVIFLDGPARELAQKAIDLLENCFIAKR